MIAYKLGFSPVPFVILESFWHCPFIWGFTVLEAKQGFTSSEVKQGFTVCEGKRGFTSFEVKQGFTVSEVNQDFTVSDVKRGFTVPERPDRLHVLLLALPVILLGI